MKPEHRMKYLALTLSFLFLMGVEIAIPHNTAYALEPAYKSPYSPLDTTTTPPEEPGIISKFVQKVKNIFGIGPSDSSIVYAARTPGEIKSGLVGQMGYSLNEIDRILKDINKSIETGTDTSASMEDLAFYRSEIEALDPQVKAEFKKTGDTLQGLVGNGTISDKILERHLNMTDRYNESVETLLTEIDALEKNPDSQHINRTVHAFKKMHREKKEKFLSSDQLPHRSVYEEPQETIIGDSISPGYSYGYLLTGINLTGAANSTLPTPERLE
jgi:hypothetical protein